MTDFPSYNYTRQLRDTALRAIRELQEEIGNLKKRLEKSNAETAKVMDENRRLRMQLAEREE